MATSRDWTALVEAAYRLDLHGERWTTCVAEAFSNLRNAGFGALCYIFDISEGRFRLRDAGWSGVPDDTGHLFVESLRNAPPELYLSFLLHERPFGTVTALPGLEVIAKFVEETAGAIGVHDSLGLVARLKWDSGLVLGANLPRATSPTKSELHKLTCVAAHLEASARLRTALEARPGQTPDLETPDVEAVLSPDGEIVDARGPAKAADARDRLREAAKRVDRARGKLRHRDPEQSLQLWEGLVDGTWSLVDHFDHDGRRFIVARRNPGSLPDPRALTPRESQIAHEVSLGKTNGETAYALGLSEATVRNHLSSAMSKLRVRRRIDLVRMAMANTREAWLRAGAEELLIRSSIAVRVGPRPDGITEAEHAVLDLVEDGLTNRQIADRRNVSERTVANQVAALLRKMGVDSRERLITAAGQAETRLS